MANKRVPEPKRPGSRGFTFLMICAAGAILISQASNPRKNTSPVNAPVGTSQKLSEAIGPAPSGDADAVALMVILDNFDSRDCPKVVKAGRDSDGSIKAICSSGEEFRIFTLKGKSLAMKCSAVKAMGINGC